jgi:hypothetical protein
MNPFRLVFAAALVVSGPAVLVACHNTTDGDPSTPSSSGENVGGAVRDAGGRAVDGVKTGAKATGDWATGVKDGIKGQPADDGG